MIPLDLDEFDMLVQQAGVQNFPIFFYVSMSDSPRGRFSGCRPSGAYAVTVSTMPDADIPNPSTSATVPWFPKSELPDYARGRRVDEGLDDERGADFSG